MGQKLRLVSTDEFIKYAESLGYKKSRQKGSHIIFYKKGYKPLTIVANKKKLTKRTTSGNLQTLAEAGISKQKTSSVILEVMLQLQI